MFCPSVSDLRDGDDHSRVFIGSLFPLRVHHGLKHADILSHYRTLWPATPPKCYSQRRLIDDITIYGSRHVGSPLWFIQQREQLAVLATVHPEICTLLPGQPRFHPEINTLFPAQV